MERQKDRKTPPFTDPKNPHFRNNGRDGLVLTFIVSLSAWFVDITALAIDKGGEFILNQGRGVTTALFFSGLTGAIIGILAGLAWALALGPTSGRDRLFQTRQMIGTMLWRASAHDDRIRIRQCNAFFLTTASFGGMSYLITHHLILDFAQPHFGALAIVAAHLCLIPICFLLYWIHLGLLRQLKFSWTPHIRLGAWIALIGGALVITSIALITAFWSVLLFLPWALFGRLAATGVLGLTAAFSWFRGQSSRDMPVSFRAALVALWLATGAWGIGTPYDAQEDRAIYETNGFTSQMGHKALTWMSDLDNDGYTPIFGGGDCAAFDASIHPGALDLPDNGLDEDCFGGDLTLDVLAGTTSSKEHTVPSDFPQRPHIVLITVDAFASRHLDLQKGKSSRTPNLGRIAKDAALFDHCFSQGPSTRLSFPSLFTSMWDTEIKRKLVGKHPFPMQAENEMLAEILKHAGYDTQAVIPVDYFSKRKWKGLHQGFNQVHEKPKRHFNKRKKPHNARHVTNASISVLEKERTKPLFLWSHYFDAHAPHRWPPGFKRKGGSTEAKYNAELQYVDKSLGRLFKKIEEHLGDNTLIIITSDHGHGFDAPRHEKKGYGYDLNTVTLHVPLIIKGPGIKAKRVQSLASTLDILPTVSNLLRVKPKRDVRGTSLVPELFGASRSRPQILFHQFYLEEDRRKDRDPLRMISVRTPTHNLVMDRKQSRVHLWNWQKDYLETQDLIGMQEEDIPVIERDLRQLLSAFLYKTQTKLENDETTKSKEESNQEQLKKSKQKKRRRKDDPRPEPFVGPTIIPPIDHIELPSPTGVPKYPAPSPSK